MTTNTLNGPGQIGLTRAGQCLDHCVALMDCDKDRKKIYRFIFHVTHVLQSLRQLKNGRVLAFTFLCMRKHFLDETTRRFGHLDAKIVSLLRNYIHTLFETKLCTEY